MNKDVNSCGLYSDSMVVAASKRVSRAHMERSRLSRAVGKAMKGMSAEQASRDHEVKRVVEDFNIAKENCFEAEAAFDGIRCFSN